MAERKKIFMRNQREYNKSSIDLTRRRTHKTTFRCLNAIIITTTNKSDWSLAAHKNQKFPRRTPPREPWWRPRGTEIQIDKELNYLTLCTVHNQVWSKSVGDSSSSFFFFFFDDPSSFFFQDYFFFLCSHSFQLLTHLLILFFLSLQQKGLKDHPVKELRRKFPKVKIKSEIACLRNNQKCSPQISIFDAPELDFIAKIPSSSAALFIKRNDK